MDEQALERARQRIAAGAADGLAGPRLDAALERARAEIMRLAHVADELEESLPKQVETAMRDGIAREVVPVSRSLAEIRGSVSRPTLGTEVLVTPTMLPVRLKWTLTSAPHTGTPS